MLHTDNALFHAIIRAAHDPDPTLAARFRPFAPAPATTPRAAAPRLPNSEIDAAWITAFPGKLVAPFRRLPPVRRRLAPAPCC